MTAMTQHDTTRRKPAQLEMIGGKSPRQRVWEVMRDFKASEFDAYVIAHRANVDLDTLLSYIKCLVAGGYLELVKRGRKRDQRVYQLTKNTGVEAPRLDKQGNPVKQGLGVECMWRTLRMLDEMNVAQLHQHVSIAGIDISVTTVKRYICALRKAGYLQTTLPSTPHRMERFRLKPSMNTGPRPPQVQSVKTVYDPNVNKVMYAEDPEELL